jgi:hypothetical protein
MVIKRYKYVVQIVHVPYGKPVLNINSNTVIKNNRFSKYEIPATCFGQQCHLHGGG